MPMPQINSMNSQLKPSTRRPRSSPSVGAHGIAWRNTPPSASAGYNHSVSNSPSSAVPVISQTARLRPAARNTNMKPPARNGRQRMMLGTTLSGISHGTRCMVSIRGNFLPAACSRHGYPIVQWSGSNFDRHDDDRATGDRHERSSSPHDSAEPDPAGHRPQRPLRPRAG